MCVVSVPAVSLKPAASASDLRGEGPREAWGPDPPTPGHGTVGASKAETWAPGQAHTPWGHWLAGDGGGVDDEGIKPGVWTLSLGCEPLAAPQGEAVLRKRAPGGAWPRTGARGVSRGTPAEGQTGPGARPAGS